MRFIKGFGRFWYDFLVGDDWKIAVAVVATLALGTFVLLVFSPPVAIFTAVLGVALMLAFVAALLVDVRRG